MAKYKILIVEDEPEIAATLVDILQMLEYDVVGTASSYDEALTLLKQSPADIALLDILLKGPKSGLDLAEKINDQFDLPYIFTTAYGDKETVAKATELGPYGYIVKPYSMKELGPSIEVAIANFANRQALKPEQADFFANNHLYVKVNSRLLRINDDDILYVEARGDYAVFKTKDNGYIVNTTITKAITKMNPKKFLKVHRSFIVNLDKIQNIEDYNIQIHDKIIPVSRRNKPELMNRIDLI